MSRISLTIGSRVVRGIVPLLSGVVLRFALLLGLLAWMGACHPGAGNTSGTGGAGAGTVGAGGARDGRAGAAGGGPAAGTGGSSPGGAGGLAVDAGADASGGTVGTGGAMPGGTDGGTAGATGTGGIHGTGGAAGPPDPTDRWQVLAPPLSRKVDILFMVDNSASMTPLQTKLLANFPVFMNILKALPMGLPDLHVAVISSDTGPGVYDLPDRHCAFRGDGGRFQSAPRGTCLTSPLAAGQTYLQASDNQQQKNYTGDITDAFTCIAALGDQGCGFEGPLKSVRLALDPVSAPDVNRGFLREDAYLAVILITNEDDCSLPDDSTLVDPTQVLMSSALGPLWSFRCNEFGHLCNINGTLQSPMRATAADNLQGCVSNDGPTGLLTKVGDEIAFLKGLKSDPNKLLVSTVSGPATPYSVEMIQQAQDVEVHPNIKHSCTLATGEFADPSVRIKQWVDAFGVNGVFQTICADSFAPALQVIASKIAGVFGPSCVSGPFAPAVGAAPPPCRVIDRSTRTDGSRLNVPLANCASNGNVPPCWTLSDDPTGCLDGKRLAINRGAATPPADLTTAFNCAPCAPGSTDVGCP